MKFFTILFLWRLFNSCPKSKINSLVPCGRVCDTVLKLKVYDRKIEQWFL